MTEGPITKVELDLEYHSQGQADIFMSEARYVVAPCGRRYGKTEGAFRTMVAVGLENRTKQLWVDTTQGNIERYFSVYLEPMLKPIAGEYKWNKQQKVLKFSNGSVVHFGSAENPENLEGFGYDYVYLNEAGHILAGPKGERLWVNTILPMTMEGRGGRGAQVFFLGTPKDIQYGPGIFRKMALRGENPNDKDVKTYRRSSYDNPQLTKALIKEIFLEIPSNEVRQEVFGEFEDQAGRNMIVNWLVAQEALTRNVPPGLEYHTYWGLDVARGGADDTALAKRRHRKLLQPVQTWHDLKDGNEVADRIEIEYMETPFENQPKWIYVDEIGYGSSALDALRKRGLPAVGVNVHRNANDRERYYRKRDELWFAGAKWVETGNLCGDDDLVRELTMVAYGYQPSTQKLKAESKDDLKKAGHPSPNRADAFLLTLAAVSELRRDSRNVPVRKKFATGGTWMSA